jgi:hypothetical protein
MNVLRRTTAHRPRTTARGTPPAAIFKVRIPLSEVLNRLEEHPFELQGIETTFRK